MKPLISLILATVVAVTLSACGTSKPEAVRLVSATHASKTVVPEAVVQASRAVTVSSPSARALSTEWCSADPKPATAKIVFDPARDVDLVLHRTYFWEDADLPSRTWCFVRDDFGRSGQCVGLGSGNCLQGWVDRKVGSFQGQTWLQFTNQHSTDARYVTLWRD